MNRPRKSTDLAPERAWFKSSHSSGAEGNCLEIADLMVVVQEPEVGVRDSKDKAGPALVFPRSSWATFVTSVSTGTLDARA
ncbi:DUF397 domain-containing protein [Streptomyces sp. NPDC085937]|uniref:DUF397 domain-containing protein n=1 Tax=Streptomyces sp. NPDC085937 TaxID=3365742 RepID=UPI0037CFDC00